MCELWIFDLLPGFQSDDDEDGSPVHAAHTAAVAHKVIQDGGKLSPHLKTQSNESHHSVDAEGFKCCWFNCSFFKTFWNCRIAQTFSFNLNTSKPPILQWVWPLHHQRAVLECTLMSCETNVLFIPLLRCNRRHDESSLLCLFGHVSLFIVMLSMNYLTETDCYSAMNLTDLLCVLNNKTWAKCTKY